MPIGEVAQLVEHTAENRGVAGSIPALATAGRVVSPINLKIDERPTALERGPSSLSHTYLDAYSQAFLPS